MNISNAAFVFGLVFLLGGVAGFFASVPPADAPPLIVDQGHGLALGLLPVNVLHNVVHVLFGVLGVAASRGAMLSARGYLRLVALVYALLVVLGLIRETQTVFGLVPIWGNDVWFHALIAVVAAYFGLFAAPTPARGSSAR